MSPIEVVEKGELINTIIYIIFYNICISLHQGSMNHFDLQKEANWILLYTQL